MTKFKLEDTVKIVKCRGEQEGYCTNPDWVGQTGSVERREGVFWVVRRKEENDWWWFHEDDLELIAEEDALDSVNHPTGGLSGHYLADVLKPQRGGNPYQAECDDIIYALNMTFDEGEAFKAIWRTCTARLGYGKKDNTALYNAQKLVHRSKRILQRAESETGE